MTAPNFLNRTLYHGDNLEFLRGMNSETVDLVATDPPFNKSRDFHATPDSLAAGAKFEDRWRWDEDVHEDWVDQVKDDWPKAWAVIEAARASWGDGMGAYLCWLGVRLMECHRVLKPTGSLYLHCDDTASHYLKALFDAIFGADQFRNEIVWKRTSAHSDAKALGRAHDVILVYARDRHNLVWNRQYQAYDPTYLKTHYRYKNDEGRIYRTDNLTATGLSGGGYEYEWNGITRIWRTPKARMAELEAKGRIRYTRNGVAEYIRYLDEMPGTALQDVWADISPINSQAKERVGYPTQKPLALYERIIKASSNPGDMVLDPFCGCATTPVAAERLGRHWVGMDIWEGAVKIVRQRMEDNRQLLADPDPQIHYATKPAQRTDENEVAAPFLKLKMQRELEPWQRLRHAEIVELLVEAQSSMGMVICAGCGRVLEREFMQLDHINPRVQGGANDITNRILLCGPCNGRKGADYTLRGLVRRNNRDRWMQNADRARLAQDSARLKAEEVRDG